jgi:hypothetical protein
MEVRTSLPLFPLFPSSEANSMALPTRMAVTPLVLLFERNQTLAQLVQAELRLAGYQCVIARTPVEVFDGLARLPVALVAVNVSHTSASRREFWVALDSQRRSRMIQTLSFAYRQPGESLLDEVTPSISADIDIWGVDQIDRLLQAIRSRLPLTADNALPASISPEKQHPARPGSAAPTGSLAELEELNQRLQASRAARDSHATVAHPVVTPPASPAPAAVTRLRVEEPHPMQYPEPTVMAPSAPAHQPVQQQEAPTSTALEGRATRALGAVLVEGQLLSPQRLEAVQQIQRLLHSVDVDYSLSQLLLIFRLITPDQLLAAQVVSRGLVTTAQIAALAHIKQDLHSIGMEYDLENLLILFRLVTPDQIREVRSE